MSDKFHTFTVMHDKGERIGTKRYKAYESFKAQMTDEFQAKVDKGMLVLGVVSEEQANNPKPKSTSKKSSRKSRK